MQEVSSKYFRNEQFASEVPFSGNLNDLDAGIFPTLLNVLKNAFVGHLARNLSIKLERMIKEIERIDK